MFEIDLEWSFASQYELRPVGQGPTRDLAIYPAEGAKITRYRPLEQYPALHAEFAKLDGGEQSCLQFAEKYGLLQVDASARPHEQIINFIGAAETLGFWNHYIQRVNEIIYLCELSRRNPAEAFRQFGKHSIELLFDGRIDLSIKGSSSPATLDVRVVNLISAIEMQAIASILADRKSVQCIECSTWFEIGGGARRSQSKFCSMRCKDSYHNRLKAQARRTSHA
jgi:hypothetical protein